MLTVKFTDDCVVKLLCDVLLMCMNKSFEHVRYLALVLDTVPRDDLRAQTLQACVPCNRDGTARVLLHLSARTVSILVLHVNVGSLIQEHLYDCLIKVGG